MTHKPKRESTARCKTLAEYLEKTGTSQQAFAAEMGVSQPVINRIVLGKRAAPGDLALRIHKKTGVPLETLIVARAA